MTAGTVTATSELENVIGFTKDLRMLLSKDEIQSLANSISDVMSECYNVSESEVDEAYLDDTNGGNAIVVEITNTCTASFDYSDARLNADPDDCDPGDLDIDFDEDGSFNSSKFNVLLDTILKEFGIEKYLDDNDIEISTEDPNDCDNFSFEDICGE